MSQNMPYTSPPASGGSASGGPSRIWYWLGGAIIVAGIVGAVAWVVLGIGALSDEIDRFQRVPFGGSGEISFSEPGSYVIYYEDGLDVFPGFRADIEPLDGGAAEDPRDYTSDLTYNLGGHSGQAVGTIRILEPGRFRFNTTTTSEAGGQLAVGPSIGRRLVFTVVGALGLAFGSAILGVTILIVTAVKRHRARRRAEQGPHAQGLTAPPRF